MVPLARAGSALSRILERRPRLRRDHFAGAAVDCADLWRQDGSRDFQRAADARRSDRLSDGSRLLAETASGERFRGFLADLAASGRGGEYGVSGNNSAA